MIYLDDILLMGQTIEEVLISRGTLIFVLQSLVRFCDKLEEVITLTFATNGTLKLDNIHFTNDQFTHRGNNSESKKILSSFVPEYSNSTLEVLKINRSPFIFRLGSTSNTDSVQVFAGTANINIKFAKLLPNTSDLTQLS